MERTRREVMTMTTRNDGSAPPFWVHGNPERKRIWYINQARKRKAKVSETLEGDDGDD